MKYIVHTKFKKKAICGEVNLPYNTECLAENGVIYHNDKPICATNSENAHQYFTTNEDSQGLERGKMTKQIQKILNNRDANYQKRWDNIWADKLVCPKYQKFKGEDYWLWNTDFFNAPISDLEYILKIIEVK